MRYLIFILIYFTSFCCISQNKKIFTTIEDALKEPEKVYILDLDLHSFNRNGSNKKNSWSYSEPNENRKLTKLPEDLIKLVNLEKLTLLQNYFDSIPPVIFKLKKLKWLNLSGCHLRKIQDDIGNLKDLRYLDISDNELNELPSSIGNLKNLKIFIILSNFNLKELPFEYGNLKRIQGFTLDDRMFDKIPEPIFNLDSLMSLLLVCYGKIDLDKEISKLLRLRNLKEIRILIKNNNNIVIPDALYSLTQLESIWIEVEKPYIFPNKLNLLKNLKYFEVKSKMPYDEKEIDRVKSLLPNSEINFE